MGKRNYEWPEAATWDGYSTQDKEGGNTERVSPEKVFARLVAEGFLAPDEDGEVPIPKAFLGQIRFDLTPETVDTSAVGTMFWDPTEHTVCLVLEGGSILSFGFEDMLWVKNAESSPLTDGQLVYISGASGDNPEVRLASNTDPAKWDCIAMVTQTIEENATGIVARGGRVRSLNTSADVPGTKWYLGAAGAHTATKPTKPAMAIVVGFVLRQHATQGVVLFKPSEPHALGLLSDVDTTGNAEGDLLVRNAAGVWVPGHVTVSESAPTGAPAAGDLFWFVVEPV